MAILPYSIPGMYENMAIFLPRNVWHYYHIPSQKSRAEWPYFSPGKYGSMAKFLKRNGQGPISIWRTGAVAQHPDKLVFCQGLEEEE